jgi:succinate dehydrogenase/fumarate reductase cytochrome b subunit
MYFCVLKGNLHRKQFFLRRTIRVVIRVLHRVSGIIVTTVLVLSILAGIVNLVFSTDPRFMFVINEMLDVVSDTCHVLLQAKAYAV